MQPRTPDPLFASQNVEMAKPIRIFLDDAGRVAPKSNMDVREVQPIQI